MGDQLNPLSHRPRVDVQVGKLDSPNITKHLEIFFQRLAMIFIAGYVHLNSSIQGMSVNRTFRLGNGIKFGSVIGRSDFGHSVRSV